MAEIKPWTIEGNPWHTEAKFISWIRGVLRKGWSKHPLKLEYIKRFRKRIKNPNQKGKTAEVWGMTCEVCLKDHVQANIEIDHRGEQGKFTTLSDIYEYAKHLFMIDYGSIRAVCKPCHKAISLGQRKGISYEEAVVEKEIIRLMKKENKEELFALLIQNGYNLKELSNATKRKQAVTAVLRDSTNILKGNK